MLAIVLCVALQPGAQPDLRASIDAVLGQRDAAITPEQWKRLGPGALPVLEEIAQDPHALSTRRARAVEGVVELHSPRATKLLAKLAQGEDEPSLVRLAAIRGAGRSLRAAKQVALLKPVLESARDVRVRAAAADVLSRHRAGCAAVRAQARREAADARFEAPLKRCGEP